MGNLLPDAVIAPSGHKCLGARVKFEVYCECRWVSCAHFERAEAYSEWRAHALKCGGTRESSEAHEKREQAYRKKIGLSHE